MKTVLMIAPYFLPRRRVGSLRPFKFAIHLKEFGWNPVILTLASPNNQLTRRERELLGDIKIIKIKPPFDRTAPQKNKSKPAEKKGSLWVDSISNWIDKQVPADSWLFLFQINYLKISREVKDFNPSLVWCTGDPWSGLWLGEKLAGDFNVPLVADFRDPWTLAGVNLRARSHFSDRMDAKIEKKVVERADKIVFTAESTLKKYEKYYDLPTKKTSVIYNSYSKLLTDGNTDPDWGNGLLPEHLHVIFFGRFRRLSPAESMINSVEKLFNIDPKIAEKLRIHSFGNLIQEESERIHRLGLQSNFVQHKPVLNQRMMSVFEKADLLLVSTLSDRNLIIPAKLWDYLAAGKPILSLVSNPEVETILRKTNSGINFSPNDLDGIAHFLKRSIQLKLNGESIFPGYIGAKDDLKQYESKETTRLLAGIFDEFISG